MERCIRGTFGAVVVGVLAVALLGNVPGGSPSSVVGVAHAAPQVGAGLTLDLSYQAAPSDDDPWHHLGQTWQALVRQKTNGRIQIRLFPGGQLSGGNQQKEIELVQNGTVQMSILPAVTLTVVDPRLQVVGLPWIVPSPEAAAKIIDGPLGQQTAGWLRAKGMEPLAIGSNGFRQLANRKHAVQTPGDLQGLKVRVPGSRLLVDTWKLLGAEPTVVNFAELYTALQQGTVDGEELPFAYKLSTKFYEVEKYATRINYSFDLIYIVVSKRVWDAIPAADQDLLRSTAQLAARDERRFLDTGDSSAVSQLQAHGMSVISLTAPQLKAFQTQARPIYTEFEGGIGKAIIQQWLNASSH